MKSFYSNGKLLITGEYVVLNGAKSLAIPTKYGQFLEVNELRENIIRWESIDEKNNIWFHVEFPIENIKNQLFSEDDIQKTLIKILFYAHQLNPNILNSTRGFHIQTKLNFPRNWGLGSSSTLINNIAQWFQIDAFQLLKYSFGGSGYDIACAQNNSPIRYQLIDEKPLIDKIVFEAPFLKDVYFVYLNQKQNSRTAINNYFNKQKNHVSAVNEINIISERLLFADINLATELISKHEIILSYLLETSTVKETYFQDFDGAIKSLGAWGGDFILALSPYNPTNYFNKKGFEVVIPYYEMLLH